MMEDSIIVLVLVVAIGASLLGIGIYIGQGMPFVADLTYANGVSTSAQVTSVQVTPDGTLYMTVDRGFKLSLEPGQWTGLTMWRNRDKTDK